MIEYIPGIFAIGLNAVMLIINLFRMRPYSLEDIAFMVFQGVLCIGLGVLWYNIWRMKKENRRDLDALANLDLTRNSPNVTPLPPTSIVAKPFRAWYRALSPGDFSGKLYPDLERHRYEAFMADLRRQRLSLLELVSRQGYIGNSGLLDDYASLPWRY